MSNLEWCDKFYNGNYGTKTKRQIETRAQGKVRLVYCVELDKTFKNMNEAAKAVNRCDTSIAACLKGYTKTCAGYH